MRYTDFRDLTRLDQSWFGLPFILSGVVLALMQESAKTNLVKLVWILPAFFLLRLSGMAFNQLIDHKIDSLNPRTQGRAIPTGRVTCRQARMIAWGLLAGFILVCFQINTFTAVMAPCAAFLVYLYSYMKRIHASCHFVLGMIHLCGPLMAFAAIRGYPTWGALFLGGAAACLISGNDILYSTQDCSFDRHHHLKSIPVSMGISKSLSFALGIHCIFPLLLLLMGLFFQLSLLFYALIPVAYGIFFVEHIRVRKQLLSKTNGAGFEKKIFFTNTVLSLATFFFIFSAFGMGS